MAKNKRILLTPHTPVLRLFKLVGKLVFFLGLISLPMAASAGIFSALIGIFNNDAQLATVPMANVRNMALLQAALNPDPNPSKGGGDITVVGGSALLPEIGPTGTIADVEVEPRGSAISIYVVRQGDTLSQIAQMFGVSANTIAWGNDISGGLIHEGQKLIILPISGIRHVVKAGDTIQTIAKFYKGDVTEISRYNDLVANSILTPGQIVIVPDGEIATPKYVAASSSVRGGGGPDYSGYYMRPIIGGVKTQGLHGYNAVDLADAYGTPIYAAAAGTVIIAKDSGWNGGYGTYVVIQHNNNTQTLYSHNTKNLVVEGQWVGRGQAIALMGSTGKATGSHVHYEIRGAKNPF
ncbi:MAG: peptidoglycan DD-metalloendopeptidase family protein [Candidatus Paceibacterota bacterium]|jgi:LysM repeat protein